MRVMWEKKGEGGFKRGLNPFSQVVCQKLRLGGCSGNYNLTRGSARRPRMLHPTPLTYIERIQELLRMLPMFTVVIAEMNIVSINTSVIAAVDTGQHHW